MWSSRIVKPLHSMSQVPEVWWTISSAHNIKLTCLEVRRRAPSSSLGMLPYNTEFNWVNFSLIQNIRSSLVNLRALAGLCSPLPLTSTFQLPLAAAHFSNLGVTVPACVIWSDKCSSYSVLTISVSKTTKSTISPHSSCDFSALGCTCPIQAWKYALKE